MGIFDLRCALSGLATSWPGTSGPTKEVAIEAQQVKDLAASRHASAVRCSMFFAEKRDGKLVPTTKPVTGYYNWAGSLVENRGADSTKVFEFPDDNDTRVVCLYREDVAEAIAGPEAPDRFARLQKWADEHGGFSSWDAGEQFTNTELKTQTERAWKIGDANLQKLIKATRPKWVVKWSTADDVANAFRAQLDARPAKAYRASEAFEVGDIVEHPTFGRGIVEALVVTNKISVKFADATKVLVHRPI